MRGLAFLVLALAPACSFDATGAGSGGDGMGSSSGDGDAGDGGSDSATSEGGGDRTGEGTGDGDGDTSGPGDTSAGPTSGADDGSSTSAGETGTTTGGLDCSTDPFVKNIVKAEAGTLIGPMQFGTDPNEGTYAFSFIEGDGAIELSTSVACPGEYSLWARVLDQAPGDGLDDPDSYGVSVDAGTEVTFRYGCQTQGQQGWSWQRVQGYSALDPICIFPTFVGVQFASGQKRITLRNLEAAADGNLRFAAVARILVTNDPNYMPTSTD